MGTATDCFLNSLATERPCDLIVLICWKKCNLWLENYCLMNCFIQLHGWWKFHTTLKILGFYLDVFDSSQSPRRQKHKKSFCTDWNLFFMNIQRTGFNHTAQKKHINPTTFVDTTAASGVSSRCLSSLQHKSVRDFLFLDCSPSALCCLFWR